MKLLAALLLSFSCIGMSNADYQVNVEVSTKITLNNQISAPSFSTTIGEEVSIAIGNQEFIFVVDAVRR